MAEYKSYINTLKKCAKEHEKDNIPFANIRTTDLCNDTADLLERLEIGINKAIEEIDFLRQHRAKYITEDNKICIDSGEVLKILKEI